MALPRSQGRDAWERFNRALAEGRVPAREIFDGAMIILGGAFLLTPGFITDIIGFMLLIPPTRAIVRRLVARLAQRRIVVRLDGRLGGRRARTGSGGPRPGRARAAGARATTTRAPRTKSATTPPELAPGRPR